METCKTKTTLKGYILLDENNNNQDDKGEKGFKNILVELYDNSNTLIATNLTIDTGGYVFNVCNKEYTIKANYSNGTRSYIEKNTITVNKDNLSNFHIFLVKQKPADITPLIALFVVSIIGFLCIYLFNKFTNKTK